MFRKKLLFLVIIIQVISILMIIFSYGLVSNYEYDTKSNGDSKKKLNILIPANADGEECVSMEMVTKKIPNLLKDYEGIVVRGSVNGKAQIDNEITEEDLEALMKKGLPVPEGFSGNKISISSHFSIKNGMFDIEPLYMEGLNSQVKGRVYTKEEFVSNSKVCVAGASIYDICFRKLKIEGKDYDMIGYTDSSSVDCMGLEMSIASIPENAKLKMIVLHFSRMLTNKEYKNIVNKFERIIGKDNLKLQDYCTMDIDERTTRVSILFIGLILAFLSGITIVMIYRYQLETAKPKIAVLLVCGYTKTRVALIALKKMMLISVTSSAVSVVIFNYILLPLTKKQFTWFPIIYNLQVECLISMVVLLLLLAFFLIELATFFLKTPYKLISAKG